MLHSLDHVIVGVRDLTTATRVYASLLARCPSWRGEHPGAGTANTIFRLENTYLELLAPVAEGPVAKRLGQRLETAGEGPIGLALGTARAETCHAWLSRQGLEPEPVEQGGGRDVESGAWRRWRRVPLPLASTRGVVLFAIEHLSREAALPPAEPAAESQAAVHALDHVVIQTADADAAGRLYGHALGLRLALDREFAQWGMRLLFFRIGGVTVELAAPLAAKGAREAADRLWGLSYRVPDADAARSRLSAAGFDVSEVRPGRKPGTRVFTVRSPTHGVATLMLEPAPASARPQPPAL